MVPVPCSSMAPVPPPSFRRAVAKRRPALRIEALILITRLPFLALRRRAVHLSHHYAPPLPKEA